MNEITDFIVRMEDEVTHCYVRFAACLGCNNCKSPYWVHKQFDGTMTMGKIVKDYFDNYFTWEKIEDGRAPNSTAP